MAKYQDASDSKIANQLAEQDKAEAEFRAKAFKPQTIRIGNQEKETEVKAATTSDTAVSGESEVVEIPSAYKTSCAKCHGANGEGTKKFPELIGVTTREEEKLSDENLVEIINDPAAYGLSSKMPAFRDKLTEAEKLEIVKYIKSLK